MRKNALEVCEAFINGTFASDGRLSTDGSTIKSYNLSIARKYKDCVYVLSPALENSKTTRGHIRQVNQFMQEHYGPTKILLCTDIDVATAIRLNPRFTLQKRVF